MKYTAGFAVFAVFYFLAKIAMACEPHIHVDSQKLSSFKSHVEHIIAKSFPELCDENIRLRNLRSKTDFAHANFNVLKFIFGGSRGHYRLSINSKWLHSNSGPPESGVEAILAHELGHILDYTKMSDRALRRFGRKFLLNKKFRRGYERGTDHQAIDRGYASGLYDFRCWQQSFLPRKAWKKKLKSGYLSPEELKNMGLDSEFICH